MRRRRRPNHAEGVGVSPPPGRQPVPGLRSAAPGAGDEAAAGHAHHRAHRVLADRGDRQLGSPYYVMEQLPTIGSPGDFPSYHSQGLYYDATPEQRADMWWGCV